MAEEFDLYGGDIYGGFTGQDRGAGHLPPAIHSHPSAGLADKVADQQHRIDELEAQLDAWHAAVREGGLDSKAAQDPRVAVAELKKGSVADKSGPADVPTLQQKEQRLRMVVAEKDIELLDLRRHLFSARQAASPHIAQVRQLLLDPGVAREFERLKKDNEAKAAEIKTLKEELQAVGFSQESKAGRMLMLKCRALQEENEDMGKELAQGKVHGLEQQVALAKGFVDDMRSRYVELEDHTHALHSEAEDLCRQVMTLRQQLKEADSQGTRAPPPKYNSSSSRAPPGPPGQGSLPSRGHEPARHDSRAPGGWNSPPGQGMPPARSHDSRGFESRPAGREDRKRSPPPLDLHDERYSRRSR